METKGIEAKYSRKKGVFCVGSGSEKRDNRKRRKRIEIRKRRTVKKKKNQKEGPENASTGNKRWKKNF